MKNSKIPTVRKQTIPFIKLEKDLNDHLTKEDTQRGNMLIKRCSTLYVIRELQIRTTRYYYTLVEWLKFKTSIAPNAGNDGEQ